MHVDWKLPDNVGTFVIRAYAVATGNMYGVSSDVKQITRNAVSLIASVPRISRVGDAFSCGVTVTAADPTFNGEVTLAVTEQGLARTSLATKTQIVTGARPTEITFDFEARVLSDQDATLVFRLTAGDDADGQWLIP